MSEISIQDQYKFTLGDQDYLKVIEGFRNGQYSPGIENYKHIIFHCVCNLTDQIRTNQLRLESILSDENNLKCVNRIATVKFILKDLISVIPEVQSYFPPEGDIGGFLVSENLMNAEENNVEAIAQS